MALLDFFPETHPPIQSHVEFSARKSTEVKILLRRKETVFGGVMVPLKFSVGRLQTCHLRDGNDASLPGSELLDGRRTQHMIGITI